MSRAFVKESDENAFEPLPERAISPHPNLVTREGLALIEAEIEKLRDEQAALREMDDGAALAKNARDLQYWSARRSSAQVIAAPENPGHVQFGVTVTLMRNGRKRSYRIVGEDEADPAREKLSYVSPLARALIGRQVGEVVEAINGEVEILDIS